MFPISKEGAKKCLIGVSPSPTRGGKQNGGRETPPSPPYLKQEILPPSNLVLTGGNCCSSCRSLPPPIVPPPPQEPLPHIQYFLPPQNSHHRQSPPVGIGNLSPPFGRNSASPHHHPRQNFYHLPPQPHELAMRERKTSGALSKVQKLRRRISLSFGKLAISKGEDDNATHDNATQRSISGLKMNGFSDEYLDKIEPNGNIPDKECGVSTPQSAVEVTPYSTSDVWMKGPHQMITRTPGSLSPQRYPSTAINTHHPLSESHRWDQGWERLQHREPLSRQLSVSSDSKLLDEDLREEQRIILRPRKPPRPKSEVYLCKDTRRSKRYSAFGGDSPFGRTEAYIKLDQLGEGSYATVYKGYSNLTNQVVALKEIRLQEEEGAPFTAIREASLLKQLKHANIVTLHDIIHTRETLTFVFEYVHTDLSQYLERHSGGLHPRNVQLFLFQLLRGLVFCHRRRILHRDIKPQNLLISEIGELKIADFGLARAKSVPSRTYSHEVVTLWYRPPDVLLGSTDYTTSLDLWGVGCIFIEMITGSPAFPGVRDVHDQLDKVFKVVGTPTEDNYPGVSKFPQYKPHRMLPYRPRRLTSCFPRLQDIPLAEAMAILFLQILPSRRISCENAMKHKYFGDLLQQTQHLDHERSLLTLPSIKLAPETNNVHRLSRRM